MLSDVSPAHILIFAVLALVVVGPKDLPAMLRKAGQFMARLRGMANEFRTSFDEMARQSELDELRREVAAMRAVAAKPMDEFRSAAVNLSGDMHQGLSGFATPPANTTASAASTAEPTLPAPEPAQAKPRKTKAVAQLGGKAKTSAGKTESTKAAPAKGKAASRNASPKKAKAPPVAGAGE